MTDIEKLKEDDFDDLRQEIDELKDEIKDLQNKLDEKDYVIKHIKTLVEG